MFSKLLKNIDTKSFLSVDDLSRFDRLLTDYKKRNDGKLPVFDSLEIHKGDEDEPPYVHVKECDYLGNTGIACVSDSYDEYGEDCLMVQEAIRIADFYVQLAKKIKSVITKDLQDRIDELK